MLEEITKNPDLEKKYLAAFRAGDTVFLEGDDSQDLYVLVSGRLDVVKGNKKITEIAEKGSMFGEMSFLLGSARTATVKAVDEVKTLRIPKDKVTSFLHEFPDVAGKISKVLAQRLDETSQMLYGLKEFCDQLPDAVVVSDRDGKILTWNAAAERLYGRDWSQMHDNALEDLLKDPDSPNGCINEVKSGHPVRQKVCSFRHPEKGIRHVSMTTTVLYDGHHNFQGVLSLIRDVTSVKQLERRYRWVRNWLIPAALLLCVLAVVIFRGYPYFAKGVEAADLRRHELKNQLARDYVLLRSLLTDSFIQADRSKSTLVLKEFFKVQDTEHFPYRGIVLLDRHRKVFDAFSFRPDEDVKVMVGNSYSGIDFHGSDKSLHKVLALYRPTREHPMGIKGLEVAFEVYQAERFLGWLVFQMDSGIMEKTFETGEEDLKKFQFQRP